MSKHFSLVTLSVLAVLALSACSQTQVTPEKAQSALEKTVKNAVSDTIDKLKMEDSDTITVAGIKLTDITKVDQAKEALDELKEVLEENLEDTTDSLSDQTKEAVDLIQEQVAEKTATLESKLAQLDSKTPLDEDKRQEIISDLTDLVTKILDITSLTLKED